MSEKEQSISVDGPKTGAEESVGRRSSWIGVDYFQALRKEKEIEQEQFRRIPSHISNILSIRFSLDGKNLAIATSDGSVGVYDATTGTCEHYIQKTATASPATGLRFRGNIATETTNDVLMAVYTNGHITEWNYKTGERLRHLVEKDNQILCIDYNSDYHSFVTGGRDHKLRVYDESTGNEVTELIGHSNRIFSVKFQPNDDNLVVSGSWDDNIKVWDVRQPQHVGVLYGPHICGDSLDVSSDGYQILSGSYSKKDSLQLWDFRTMKLFKTISDNQSMLYCAQFSKIGAPKVACGGVHKNQLQLFDHTDPDHAVIKTQPTQGTYTLDFSPASHQLAMAGAGDTVGVLDLKTNSYSEFEAIGYREIAMPQ